MNPVALELLDRLTANWTQWELYESEYLNVVLPRIVRGDPTQRLNETEKALLAQLREELSPADWERLPELVRTRRAENTAAEERVRAERAKKEAAAEARQAAARQEQIDRHLEEEERRRRRGALLNRILTTLKSDYLGVDALYSTDPDVDAIPRLEYDTLKAEFVQAWARQELKTDLDREQAEAVGAGPGNVQVIARAGSGKTRTLISRALFLQQRCGVGPHQLLLLAFNKKAAEEMETRVAEHVGDLRPHVMTFHALAHALVHPEEELVFDDADQGQHGASREVQEVIDEHVRSGDFGATIRELMLDYFREDWERIVDGRFETTMEEFLVHRRALPRETLRGEYVKSFGEKVIANALFEHGVDYRYERNFRWNGANYKPDFTIQGAEEGGVVIEYLGLAGEPAYDERTREKRYYWSGRPEWKLLEFTPQDLLALGVKGLVEQLLGKLREVGWRCVRRTEEEIWALVRERALDGFTSAMKTFVGRCRKLNWGPEALFEKADGHRAASSAERLFVKIGTSIYSGYLARLRERQKEDFDGLMWRAIAAVREGRTRFRRRSGREQGNLEALRFVLIDEFQDFSPQFHALTVALRQMNPGVRFFCVGDDWQAINSFAGSDPRYFREFGAHFLEPSRRQLLTNYRSARSVVEAGNAVMLGLGVAGRPGETAAAGEVLAAWMDQFQPRALEQGRHGGDEITPALLRITRNLLDRNFEVVILSRRNGLPWYVQYADGLNRGADALPRFLAHLRSFLPEEDRRRVTISTVHKYKGLEREAVILADAVERSFPLIHPHWVFLRIFGDSIESIEKEERRLFYVALTRARSSLTILTDALQQSPFFVDIGKRRPLASVKWDTLPTPASLDGARLEVRVFDAYAVREELKRLGYSFDRTERCWCRAIPEQAFSLEQLASQPWASGRRVEVRSETGDLLHRLGL